jgi:hypothetical protein
MNCEKCRSCAKELGARHKEQAATTTICLINFIPLFLLFPAFRQASLLSVSYLIKVISPFLVALVPSKNSTSNV